MEESNHQQIKIISECFVKPKYEVEASKQPHYLASIDLIFLSLDHMQKGLLFHAKPQNIQSQLLDKLKISLSHSLVYFYPLAGQLATQKFDDEHAIWVYVDCTKGPGARIIHATVNFSVSDILSSKDIYPVVPCLFDLGEKAVNYDGHTRPLLSIQVTELLDGVFIGFTMNHSLADGTSLWHFISTLSEIFLQLEDENHNGKNTMINNKNNYATNFQSDSFMNVVRVSRKPIHKPYFPEGYGPIIKLPYLEPNEFISRFNPGILRERIFHISSKAMSMLKGKANNNQELCNNVSSFQALAAFIWTSITRARNLDPSLEIKCSFSLSWRARITPPYSEDCFGNYIEGVQCASKVGDLLSLGLGSAALMIKQSVEAMDESNVRQRLYNYAKAPFVAQTGSKDAFYEPNGVLIGGSARFDMYGPEFGLGRAVAVLAGYANKDDGKVTVNPGRQGGSSVDLEICLRPETMNALESDEEFMSIASM